MPVSSSGHLVIVEEFAGVSEEEFGLGFDAAVHLGTLLAVLLFFRYALIEMLHAWASSVASRRWNESEASKRAWFVILATIPAGITGFLLEGPIEESVRSLTVVGACLILFTIPMIVAEAVGARNKGLQELDAKDALLIGLAQCFALIPGVSRSGMTISAGMVRELKRPDAATFAFLISIPIIGAAGLKQFLDLLVSEEGAQADKLLLYAVGMVTAAVVGYGAIGFLMRFLGAKSLKVFIVYRIVLGALVLIAALI